jgi:hypothetical protein
MNINDQFPSKYLKASDLNGEEIIVTIKDCVVESLGEDKRPVLYFAGKEKGVVLNKTNATNISDAYGGDTDEWVGKKVVLYTAWVDFQGRSVESIRIRPARPSDGQKRPAVEPNFDQAAPPAREFAPVDDSDIPF